MPSAAPSGLSRGNSSASAATSRFEAESNRPSPDKFTAAPEIERWSTVGVAAGVAMKRAGQRRRAAAKGGA